MKNKQQLFTKITQEVLNKNLKNAGLILSILNELERRVFDDILVEEPECEEPPIIPYKRPPMKKVGAIKVHYKEPIPIKPRKIDIIEEDNEEEFWHKQYS